MILIQDSRS